MCLLSRLLLLHRCLWLCLDDTVISRYRGSVSRALHLLRGLLVLLCLLLLLYRLITISDYLRGSALCRSLRLLRLLLRWLLLYRSLWLGLDDAVISRHIGSGSRALCLLGSLLILLRRLLLHRLITISYYLRGGALRRRWRLLLRLLSRLLLYRCLRLSLDDTVISRYRGSCSRALCLLRSLLAWLGLLLYRLNAVSYYL